jgi:transcriptional regulator with PAS, ATPase and Fis domain
MEPVDSPTTEALEPAGFHTLVRKFRLTALEGPDHGLEYCSQGARTIIGTHPSAQLVLRDPTLSRLHCEILVDEGRALLRDLGSRNGTLIDGTSVLAAHLGQGSVITLGRTRLRFELWGEHIKIPLSEKERFGLVVGRSAAMRAVFVVLERAALSDVNVLLLGETGTGKGLAAESLHSESQRRDGPLVTVDCAAIPAGLLESELFGHERGAFTSADRKHVGAFEAAHGGTLFLDEIGELSCELQPKLLRAIEAREIYRVGGEKPIQIDIRIVAATNRNLPAEVNAGRFRSDLFYRLAVLEILLPPLRQRFEDLPLVVDEILAGLDAGNQPAAATLRAPRFLAELRSHSWPGNLRELKNYLECCLALEEPAPLRHRDASTPTIDPTQPLRVVRDQWIRYVERRYLEELLREHGDNVSAAARAAGLSRIHLHRILSRIGLR